MVSNLSVQRRMSHGILIQLDQKGFLLEITNLALGKQYKTIKTFSKMY